MLAVNYFGIRKMIDELRNSYKDRYTGLERKLGMDVANILELILDQIPRSG